MFGKPRILSIFPNLSENSVKLTNSVYPDEMQHKAAFQLGLHCLQKYLFIGFPNTKG